MTKNCTVCGKPCIAHCPYCFEAVHAAYGYNGDSCSIVHEGSCEGARLSRVLEPRQSSPPCDSTFLSPIRDPIFDTELGIKGKTVVVKLKKKGRARR